MATRCGLLLALVVGLVGSAAAATELPLLGGRVGRVRATTTPTALFSFDDETDLTPLGDPRCPAVSSVRIGFGDGSYRVTTLPCANWQATNTGYVYHDQTSSVGVRRIILRADRLHILLQGERLADIRGPVPFLDAALQIGATRACGRFGSFRRNRPGRIVAAKGSTPCALPRPNILVIDLDDTRADGIDRMPVLQSRVIGEGVSFRNSFVPNPLCCPSRASIFTGLYALHHQTRTLVLPLGGATSFRQSGADQQTIATWLRGAGYRTGLFGKYLNAYGGVESTAGPGGRYYVPPGWDRWQVMGGGEHYGGINGATYSLVDEHGLVTVYDDHTTDAQYSTDLLAEQVRAFAIDAVGRGQNFFAVFTPYASHGDTNPGIEPKPAARHTNAFAGLPQWRPGNFNEADVSDKPLWLQALPDASPIGIAVDDLMRQRAYETLLSVDEQIALFLDQFDALGVGDDTIVLVTSDNGVTWGEHGFFGQGKECPYEEAIRVPMAVRYPRRVSNPPVVSAATVLNIDVPATVAALASVPIPVDIDGASFAGWLVDSPPGAWRDDFLLEHWSSLRNSWLTWTGQPLDGDRVELLYGPALPLPRAGQLFEFDSGNGVDPDAIAVPIGANEVATYSALGAAVQFAVPNTTWSVNATQKRVTITDQTPDYLGLQFLEPLDQANRFEPAYPMPDYFGVRDVANQYVYVEYGSGEVELYDLATDSGQLDNRADHASYMGERIRLAARLRELLQ
jgi:N-acetylglucosamine-6-sulfatase